MIKENLILTISDIKEIISNGIVTDFFIMYRTTSSQDILYRDHFIQNNKLLLHKAFFIPTGCIASLPIDIYNSLKKENMLENLDHFKKIDSIMENIFCQTKKSILTFKDITTTEKLKKYLINSYYALRFETLIQHFLLSEEDVLNLLFYIIHGSTKYFLSQNSTSTKKETEISSKK